MDTSAKKIYLSFDDGPHPVATPFVLDMLKQYDARATFFCI
jgi:peptidoglycan/xylan/chitin deacetylase (PgdA/CDA1 family)